MKTIEEIRKWGIDMSLKDLNKIQEILDTLKKDLESKETGVPENAGIAIKTVSLFFKNKTGFETWFKSIREEIINKVEENRKQTRH
jgi:hypothetical protein